MIPRFNVYHNNLHGSFILFDKYIQFLKSDYFNGYVYLDDHRDKIFLFLLEGELQTCLRQSNGYFERLNLMQVEDYIHEQTSISSFRCNSVYIDYFSRFHTLKLLHKELSTDIVDPEKLINKCKTENFSGILEITSQKEKNYIYFLEGQIMGSMSPTKEGFFDRDGRENTTIPNISHPGSINIYKISFEPQDNSESREKLIECYENLFNTLDKNCQKKDFATIWRECALELSDKYVFLDPFAEEFNYSEGKLDVWEKINSKTLALGLEELTQKLLSRTGIAVETVEGIKEQYSQELADYEIRS